MARVGFGVSGVQCGQLDRVSLVAVAGFVEEGGEVFILSMGLASHRLVWQRSEGGPSQMVSAGVSHRMGGHPQNALSAAKAILKWCEGCSGSVLGRQRQRLEGGGGRVDRLAKRRR